MKKILAVFLFGSFAMVCFAYVRKEPSPAVSKSLVFPIAGKRSSIGSFWGDVRDGGKRKHEGIDIFARKRTPVVAICDGIVTAVGNTPRGGKTVWLQSFGHAWTAYYAHLNEQKVRRGQFVKKGQVIGTVGNTGNAKTTPPHLHFGIYTLFGAVNPLPYVKSSPKISAPKINELKKETAIAKVATKKKSSSSNKTTASSFPSQYIWKTVYLPSDPSAKYYVTKRSNVVRVQKEGYQVVGQWKKSTNVNYPYQITLSNKQQLYVTKSGKLITTKGNQVGTVS